MFESLSSKGPKLVYSHSRQGVPERKVSEKTSPTPISSGPASSVLPESHVIPRPSVTVAAQTRKPSSEEHSQKTSRGQGEPSANGDSPGTTVQSQTSASAANGMILTDQQLQANDYYQYPELDQAGVYENYNQASVGVNGLSYRFDSEPPTTTNNMTSSNGISINIERVNNLDDTKHTDSGRNEKNSSPSPITSDSFNNSNGYHGGYRVYRGKVYEITREIPIILADGNVATRLSSSPATVTNVSSSTSKPAHISTATASIIKTTPATNGSVSSNHPPRTDLGLQVPRALPAPKLNGKTSNGILPFSSQASPDYDSPTAYDQLSPHQQQQSLFREHRRPIDDSRFTDGPELLTYIGGAQISRRPNTVSSKKGFRELSPQNWMVRGRTGSPSSPVQGSTASRRLSPQRSASVTRSLPFRSTGGQIWTVISKTPPHSPRQRSASTTGQQVVTRASYRLDPNISAKLQNASPASNQPPKSILKTSSSPSSTAAAISSGKTEQYDNHPLPSDHSGSTSSSYLLPRPRASLAYRDFDFSGLPHQHPQVKNHKRNVQQSNSLPSHHQKSKPQATHTNTSRRPATAGAALQKNGEVGSKGTQPQKKSVTFDSHVRLHVDNNVSTIRSLSIDS